jgi:hypothetical protein
MKDKIITKILLACWKKVSKDCSESLNRISVPAFLCCHWSIPSSDSQPSHILESQAVSGTTFRVTGGCLTVGTSFMKRLTGRIFRISKKFYKSKQKLYF